MTSNTISWRAIRNEALADPKVKAEYDALETEFNLARQVISFSRKAKKYSNAGHSILTQFPPIT